MPELAPVIHAILRCLSLGIEALYYFVPFASTILIRSLVGGPQQLWIEKIFYLDTAHLKGSFGPSPRFRIP